MTTVSQIIRDAYRESNLLAVNESPTGAQSAEAFRLLSRIVESVYGEEIGERLVDVSVGNKNVIHKGDKRRLEESDLILVPENTRLVLSLSSPASAYLPPLPQDGARFEVVDAVGNLATHNFILYGNGQNITGSNSLALSTNSFSGSYMYRRDLGGWVLVSPIEPTDDFPFPEKFDDYFIIRLAMRLNPRHDVTLAQESVMEYRRLLKQLKSQYAQRNEVGVEGGLLPRDGYGHYLIADFESGREWN